MESNVKIPTITPSPIKVDILIPSIDKVLSVLSVYTISFIHEMIIDKFCSECTKVKPNAIEDV